MTTQTTANPAAQFNEGMYLAFYNDIDALVPSTYATGLDHYNAVGQFLGANKKEGFFTGTSGNDTVTGFGDDMDLYGVGITATFTPGSGPNGPAAFMPSSFGVGEKDVLVGRNDPAKEDGFFLSVPNGSYSRTNATSGMLFGTSSRLYVGQGEKDFARAKNFNSEYDYVSLSGSPDEYIYRYRADKAAPGGVSLKIYTKDEKDLVGIVEGIHDYQPRAFLADGTFRLSGRVPARGFNDAVYDAINGVSGGLDHYAKTGQYKPKTITGVFSGAAAGSPTTNSTTPANGNDTIIAYGRKTQIAGVDLLMEGGFVKAGNNGVGQKDVLVGSLDGVDEFLFGVGNQQLYVGDANDTSGFATVKNFQHRKDSIVLAGPKTGYQLAVVNGSTEIRTVGNDLIGIVEDVTCLSAFNVGTQTIVR
jgi:hypothetical protein